MTPDILLIAALILSGFTTALLINEIRKNQNAKIKAMEERIKKLETAGYKRMNHISLEEVEHAISALVALENDLEIRSNMVRNALAHLSKAHTPDKKK